MVNRRPSISIFFPFLNDWGTVGSLVALSIATVTRLTDDWEVIIVNDGSKREDREALELIVETINLNSEFRIQNSKLKKALKTPGRWPEDSSRGFIPRDSFQVEKSDRIRIIDHERNRGYGGVLRSGFAASKKDLVFYTDCDAQYDPRELTKLYEKMKDNVVLVNGYKIKRHDPLHRIFAGRLYHYLVKAAFRLPIRDTDCDFRLIRRSVFNRVRLGENTGTICVELVKKIAHFYRGKIVEVPVHHFWRTSGKSQFFNFKRLFKTAVNLGKLWWRLMVKKEY